LQDAHDPGSIVIGLSLAGIFAGIAQEVHPRSNGEKTRRRGSRRRLGGAAKLAAKKNRKTDDDTEQNPCKFQWRRRV
jgi:hypothetical protein